MIRAGLIALALFSPLPAIAEPHFSGNDDLAPDRVQSGSVFRPTRLVSFRRMVSLILAISGSIGAGAVC